MKPCCDESLMPLWQDHEEALFFCRGLQRPIHTQPASAPWWLEAARDIVIFHARELEPHLRQEESQLFPILRDHPALGEHIRELDTQHGQLRTLAAEIKKILHDPHASREALVDGVTLWAGLLEIHVLWEERLLFPLYLRHTSNRLKARVERALTA